MDISFFKSNHHPYYIWTIDYLHKSAGVRVRHQLCHILNNLGFEAYVVPAKKTSPYLRAPHMSLAVRKSHVQAGRIPIAVIPEIPNGNPLKTPVLARWMLNKSSHWGVEADYSENEKIFYWDEVFLSGEKNAEKLVFPGLDGNIFNDDGTSEDEREGFCYYAHKYLEYGKGKIADVLIEKGISLCQDIPRTPEEIAAILRKSKALYCYEPSAIMAEAAACGCAIVFIETGYLSQFDLSSNPIYNKIKKVRKEDLDVENHPALEIDYKCITEAREKGSRECINRFIETTQSEANRIGAQMDKAGFDEYALFHDIEHYLQKHRRNYVYGAGKYGRECYYQLQLDGHDVDGFVVTDGMEKAGNLCEKPICYLSDIRGADCGLIIALNEKNRGEVIEYLRKYDYENAFVYF